MNIYHFHITRSRGKLILKTIILIVCLLAIVGIMIIYRLNILYKNIESTTVSDRNGSTVMIIPNDRGNYSSFATSTPHIFTDLLTRSEDRYFYYHPGINPVGTSQLILSKVGIGKRRSASTLDQQLTKILFENETERNIWNKAIESVCALVLDLSKSKDDILLSYSNTAYFGNHIQGLRTASEAYFDKSADRLTTEETLQLLSTLNNPSYNNPATKSNIERSKALASRLGIDVVEAEFIQPDTVNQNLKAFRSTLTDFEIAHYISLIKPKDKEIKLLTDAKLTTDIQSIIKSAMPSLADRDAHNMAVIVIKLPENEILSLVGSPDPKSTEFGQQINMLNEPRQIASTIKPFVYAKAFEMGARPYTLIDDKEYRYTTYEGQVYYLRNFDAKYHGRVTAAYALDNSINVPAVKTLDFVGVDNFATLLGKLGYTDTLKVHDFEMGVALGTIDMTPIDLAHYYTIFPNQGQLTPLRLFLEPKFNKDIFPQESGQVIAPEYTQLVTKIISNRYLAIDQFGYKSDLNLQLDNYALKTGTSDGYRDSWVMGFTPDFLVGVWVGNADETSTENLSGQSGAGEIWSRVMELMKHTTYNEQTPFTFNKIRSIDNTDASAYGLSGDDIEKARNLFIDNK